MTAWSVFLASSLIALIGTWFVRWIAPRAGLVDSPDGVRKLQRLPVPVGGGIAVFLAVVCASSIAVLLDPECSLEFSASPMTWLALGLAALIIVAVGLVDDRYALRARHKLIGQFLAISVFVFLGGAQIRDIHILGLEIPLGIFGIPITFIWLLAAVNALNLLDGMDGLLGTVGMIGCLAIGFIAMLAGHPLAAVIAFALAGGLLGFLRFNLPPATVYCGDCGSMLVGLTIGSLAILGSMKSHALVLGVPAAVLVLPFLDTSAAIVRRKLSGRAMAIGDYDHLHHVLLRRGMTIPSILLLLGSLGSVAAVGALAGVYFEVDLIAMVTALGVVLTLLTAGLFGVAEVRMVRDRAQALLTSTRVRIHRGRSRVREDSEPAMTKVAPVTQH